MNKVGWTIFGMALTVLLAFGGFALGLMPQPGGSALPVRIVVPLDNEAERLKGLLAEVQQERDRQAKELADLAVDRDALLDDLADALEERDVLRRRVGKMMERASLTGDAAVPAAQTSDAGQSLTYLAADGDAATMPASHRQNRAADARGSVSGAIRIASLDEDPVLVPAAPAAMANRLERGLEAYRAGDYPRAFDIWLPLAEAGNARAQFYIGGLYADGVGVPQDPVEAYLWFRRSDEGGYERAAPLLEQMAASMTGDQLLAVQRLLLAENQ